MRRLRRLFRNIKTVRLMGGEPLLHQDPASFISITRTIFPGSHIRFVTNGILLPKAPTSFWETCRNTNTTINLIAYPPLKHINELRTLCESERVSLTVRSVKTFNACNNLLGDSDKRKAFEFCRNKFFCPLLKEGRLYHCAMPAYVHYFNQSFGYQIVADKGINIHARSISGAKILRQLNMPIETCRWCTQDDVPFLWAVSKKDPADWDTNKHRNMV